MNSQIDYYFSSGSPWSYLAGPRFKTIVEKYQLTVNWKPFDLFAAFAVTGQKKLADRSIAVKKNRLVELERWASFLKMTINVEPKYFPPKSVSVSANKIIIAGGDSGKDITELVNAFMRALWAEERDIANSKTLIAIADEQGFDGRALYEAAQKEFVQNTFDQNTKEALKFNVFGSPTWIYQGELFWGQDRLEFLNRAIAAR